jgi:hypothetical protein
MNTPHPYDLVIGLDRSDRKADLRLINTHSAQRRSQIIDTNPEALWEWLLLLREQYPHARVALCLEQPAVHLVAFLEAYEWITLYPVISERSSRIRGFKVTRSRWCNRVISRALTSAATLSDNL